MREKSRSSEWIGLVVKERDEKALEIAKSVCAEIMKQGIEVRVPVEMSIDPQTVGAHGVFRLGKDRVDKLVVIGGDGTLLRTLRFFEDWTPVIMTIGAGRRCFFFDLEGTEGPQFIEKFLRGEYVVHSYQRLLVTVEGKGKWSCLNEAVIAGDRGRIAELEVLVGQQTLYRMRGDGVIIASTPGSTAYSLSAGGPVIDLLLEAIIVTPLNPMQLQLRPVVLNPLSSVRVRILGRANCTLYVDGDPVVEVGVGETVSVRLHEVPARVARFRWVRFYEKTFSRP